MGVGLCSQDSQGPRIAKARSAAFLPECADSETCALGRLEHGQNTGSLRRDRSSAGAPLLTTPLEFSVYWWRRAGSNCRPWGYEGETCPKSGQRQPIKCKKDKGQSCWNFGPLWAALDAVYGQKADSSSFSGANETEGRRVRIRRLRVSVM